MCKMVNEQAVLVMNPLDIEEMGRYKDQIVMATWSIQSISRNAQGLWDVLSQNWWVLTRSDLKNDKRRASDRMLKDALEKVWSVATATDNSQDFKVFSCKCPAARYNRTPSKVLKKLWVEAVLLENCTVGRAGYDIFVLQRVSCIFFWNFLS